MLHQFAFSRRTHFLHSFGKIDRLDRYKRTMVFGLMTMGVGTAVSSGSIGSPYALFLCA